MSVTPSGDYYPEADREVQTRWLESVMSGAWDRAHPEFAIVEGDPMTDDLTTPEPEPDDVLTDAELEERPTPADAEPVPELAEDDGSTTEPEPQP